MKPLIAKPIACVVSLGTTVAFMIFALPVAWGTFSTLDALVIAIVHKRSGFATLVIGFTVFTMGVVIAWLVFRLCYWWTVHTPKRRRRTRRVETAGDSAEQQEDRSVADADRNVPAVRVLLRAGTLLTITLALAAGTYAWLWYWPIPTESSHLKLSDAYSIQRYNRTSVIWTYQEIVTDHFIPPERRWGKKAADRAYLCRYGWHIHRLPARLNRPAAMAPDQSAYAYLPENKPRELRIVRTRDGKTLKFEVPFVGNLFWESPDRVQVVDVTVEPRRLHEVTVPANFLHP